MYQRLLLKVIISANVFALAFAAYSFYNIECKSLDKTFAETEYCYIKAINRSVKSFSVKFKLFKLPKTNVQVNWALHKRDQGWKNFFININFDGCKFFESKQQNPIVRQVYNIISGYTNINHTCPYNHDIIIDNLTTIRAENNWGSLIPLPPNDYRIKTMWGTNGIWQLEISIFLRVT